MPSKISFYMDEHVPSAVTKGLRLRGVDVLTCVLSEKYAALRSRKNEMFIVARAQHSRFLTEFIKLHLAGISHAGIAHVHQQTSIGKIVSGLLLIWEVLAPDEMVDSVEYL
jgi:hypothetical protein